MSSRHLGSIGSLVALGLTLAVGCAVGSAETDAEDAPASSTPKVDAGNGTPHSSLPEGEPGTEEDAGTEPDPQDAAVAKPDASDASVVVDAGTDSGPTTPTGPCSFSGVLATYDFASVVGTSDLAAKTTGGGITASVLSRSGVTAVSSSQAMNASGWPTGGLDLTKHFAFSVTPPSGCHLTVASVALDLKASNTGPSSAAVATSGDAYTSRAVATVSTAGGASTVTIGSASNVAGTVTVHVYGHGASSGAGTMRLQNTLTVSGQVTP